ncbi:hypothetical protein FS837_009642 [Tulasnella sp. UAMH 9824]|nr:hypothetical protein FS837_009642 [Tulasnella sp. UAMH 9824]
MASQPVVLVTGASKGIGFCVARILLTRHRAAVLAFSRSRTAELEELAREFPTTLTIVQGDVTSSQSISATIKTAVDTYGHLDSVILNAGTLGSISRISSSTTSEWKDVFDINFFSLVETIQAALPSLRESQHKGRVIFVSSGAADRGYTGWGPYSASKAAMNSLCRTLANEEKGIIAVSMQATVRADGVDRMDPSELEKFTSLHSTGKLVKPEECGQVIAGLAVAASPEMSGQYVSWDDEAMGQFRE